MDQFFAWLKEYKELIIGVTTVLGGILAVIGYFLKKKKRREETEKAAMNVTAAGTAAAAAAGNATSGSHSPINNGGTMIVNNNIPIEEFKKAIAEKTIIEIELEKTRGELALSKGELLRMKLRQDQIDRLMPLVERLEILTHSRRGQREDAHIHLLYKLMREIAIENGAKESAKAHDGREGE